MSWNRMSRVVERYERLAYGQIKDMKALQRTFIEDANKDNPSSRNQLQQLEEQLLSGLQQLLAMREEIDEEAQELFDQRIEPIRRQIQSAVAMNKNLPAPRPSNTYDDSLQTDNDRNPYEDESIRYLQQTDVRVLELKAKADEARATAEATQKINKDMRDLEEIFMELATIVHEQHDMVDSIEEHVERAVQDVQRGNQQLKKAVQHKAAKAPIVAGVVGGLVIGGPVGLAAGSALAGISAGVGGIVAGLYGGRWFKNSVKRDLEQN